MNKNLEGEVILPPPPPKNRVKTHEFDRAFKAKLFFNSLNKKYRIKTTKQKKTKKHYKDK